MPLACYHDATFALELAAPVDVERTCGIVLVILAVFPSIKDVIRRDLDHRYAVCRTCARDVFGSHTVDDVCAFRLALGPVDGRIGGRVDHDAGALTLYRGCDRFLVGEIHIRTRS